jgi:hypothetical protein
MLVHESNAQLTRRARAPRRQDSPAPPFLKKFLEVLNAIKVVFRKATKRYLHGKSEHQTCCRFHNAPDTILLDWYPTWEHNGGYQQRKSSTLSSWSYWTSAPRSAHTALAVCISAAPRRMCATASTAKHHKS